MADLKPLIRVRNHALEQKQKFLAELYRQAEEYETQKKTLLKQRDEERMKMEELGAEMLPYFGPYSENVEARVADIDEAMVKLNARIEAARDDMHRAFEEVKKLQITQDAREAEERRKLDKKESNEMDEIGIDGYRRNQGEA